MSNVSASLIPCDGAIFNGKWNLIGAFSIFQNVQLFPVRLQPFHVYCRLSDVPIGEKFELVLQLAQEQLTGDGAEMDVRWTHKLEASLDAKGPSAVNPTFDFSVPVLSEVAPGQFAGIVLERPGVYEVQALFNGALVGVSMIAVVGPAGE